MFFSLSVISVFEQGASSGVGVGSNGNGQRGIGTPAGRGSGPSERVVGTGRGKEGRGREEPWEQVTHVTLVVSVRRRKKKGKKNYPIRIRCCRDSRVSVARSARAHLKGKTSTGEETSVVFTRISI